ncbi:MAG: hypothetical protein IT453_14580, partial [Planctomycetes bacterium]|nr:hypothetical protein [Planctomycetota bacterium]
SDAQIVHATPLADTEGASTVAVLDGDAVHCPGKRIVIVGTDDADGGQPAPAPSGGRLVILEHDVASDSLAVRASIEPGATVQSVAASVAIAPPPSGTNDASFTVLVGADCAAVGGERGSLQRRDFSYHCSNGVLVVTEDAVAAWPGATSSPQCIVRDIVIDEAKARAYVAAYSRGVFAFDVANGGLLEDTSPSWPLVMRDNQGNQREAYANVVALDPAPEVVPGTGGRLFVGWGRSFAGEWQYFGDSARVECATSPAMVASNPAHGVHAFRLDANEDPLPGLAGVNGPTGEIVYSPTAPHDFDGVSAMQVARYGSSSELFLYAATDTRGFAVMRSTLLGTTWSTSTEARWDGEDPGKVALSAHDHAVVFDDPAGTFLYVATEDGVATFDLAQRLADARCAGGSLGTVPAPCTELQGGVTLAAFPNPNGRLLAATQLGAPTLEGGLRVFDVSAPSTPIPLGFELQKGGRGFAVAAALGAWSGTKPADADRRRWVFTTQSDGLDVAASFTVKLFDLGTQNDPHDPDCPPPCTPAVLAATWQDAPASDLLEGIAVAEVADGRELAVYVPYGVNGDSTGSFASARAGVVVLRVTLDGAGQPHFTKVQKTSDFLGVDPKFKAGRATFDAATQRLFVAWGTGGLAVYDASSPYKLVRLAKRDLSSDFGAYHKRLSPTQVLVGPTDCGTEFLYVAFLDDGVGVLPSDLTGPISFVPLAGQAISITFDPADATRHTLFVSEGRAGIERVVIDPCGP